MPLPDPTLQWFLEVAKVAADSISFLFEGPFVPFDVEVEIRLCSFDEMKFLFGFDFDGGREESGFVPDFVVVVVGEGKHFIEKAMIAGVFFHF